MSNMMPSMMPTSDRVFYLSPTDEASIMEMISQVALSGRKVDVYYEDSKSIRPKVGFQVMPGGFGVELSVCVETKTVRTIRVG